MITSTQNGGALILTVDRPEARNALGDADVHELHARILGAADDPAVTAIVITGAGDRSFVAGGDLAELSVPRGVADALTLPMQRVFTAIADSPKVTIAAVNGYALGGGFELALACDLRVAHESASFGLPELSWSMLPAAGGLTRLVRLVGPSRTLELTLTGRRLSAAEALDWGVVNRVTSDPVLEAALELAELIAERGPVAVSVARLVTRLAADASGQSSLIAETLGLAALFGTADKSEGTRAFLEKRAPRFTGR